MALRNLAHQFKQRDWAGVVFEIAVVVVGVYLGLQASNWNQDRLDHARGREYLQRMAGDLQVETRLLSQTLAFQNQVGDYGKGAIGYAESGKLYRDSPWQTVLAYYQASQIWGYRQPSTTFQEIQSSGELSLIENPSLRARIAAHYGENAGSRAMEVIGVVPKYRERVRGLTLWAIQQYIWTHCYRSGTNLGQLLVDCPSPISDAEASALLEQLRGDSELTSELRFWLASVGVNKLVLATIQDEAKGLEGNVNAELARR